MSETRKIAAILVADVVGYSQLAGADEDRTLSRLRGLRSDLIDPAIAAHHGRVVKRTGDGIIIEFRSVVDAVRCAIEVQTAWSSATQACRPNAASSFASASILGDVVEESDGDLMGDGVNIAARLEGICSRARSACPRTPIVREVDLSSSRLRFCQLCQRLRSIGLGRPAVWGRQWGKHSVRWDGAGPAEEAQGPGPVRPRRMIRIAITAAAYDAICATLPLGSVGFETEANERGERYVWLEDAMADRLAAMRGPGESLRRRCREQSHTKREQTNG